MRTVVVGGEAVAEGVVAVVVAVVGVDVVVVVLGEVVDGICCDLLGCLRVLRVLPLLSKALPVRPRWEAAARAEEASLPPPEPTAS